MGKKHILSARENTFYECERRCGEVGNSLRYACWERVMTQPILYARSFTLIVHFD